MKDLIKEVDRLLFQIKVSGDDVLLMAQARSILKNVYEMEISREEEKKTA